MNDWEKEFDEACKFPKTLDIRGFFKKVIESERRKAVEKFIEILRGECEPDGAEPDDLIFSANEIEEVFTSLYPEKKLA